jgi:hypothetical protein
VEIFCHGCGLFASFRFYSLPQITFLSIYFFFVSNFSEIEKLPIGSDVWDHSGYGDVDWNEALALEIFDFSEELRRFPKYIAEWFRDGTQHTTTANIREE